MIYAFPAWDMPVIGDSVQSLASRATCSSTHLVPRSELCVGSRGKDARLDKVEVAQAVE